MQFEASRLEGLEHRTDAQSAPEVFFTPIITPESLRRRPTMRSDASRKQNGHQSPFRRIGKIQ